MTTTVALETWPSLPLGEWKDTLTTLQRWTQIVGKTRLACSPFQNHWWHVALYVTTRGLGTSPMPSGARCFDVEFDFIDHRVIVHTTDGDSRTMPLVPRSVADFYHEYVELLHSLDIRPKIWPVPVELTDTLRFDSDHEHASYDADAVNRCWRILVQTDRVLKRFRGRFVGKSSPSHLWWGAFDLACTRFSGRPAPRHPGGIPNCPDYVTVEAYSHECISAGWWPGTPGSAMPDPAFYAYAYPEPKGCPDATIGPRGGYYETSLREWVLPYDVVRTAADPDETLLEFLTTTYESAATLGGWDRTGLERPT